MKGFMFPRTATGKASLLPDPPWHYSGAMLALEYRTDPTAVAELLPAGVEPAVPREEQEYTKSRLVEEIRADQDIGGGFHGRIPCCKRRAEQNVQQKI